MRKQGSQNLVCFALFAVRNATDIYLGRWEKQMQDRYQPKWNTPWVNKYCDGITKNQAFIPEERIKRVTNGLADFKYRDRPQFTTFSTNLTPMRKLKDTDAYLYDTVMRLGDPRFRFNRLVQKI